MGRRENAGTGQRVTRWQDRAMVKGLDDFPRTWTQWPQGLCLHHAAGEQCHSKTKEREHIKILRHVKHGSGQCHARGRVSILPGVEGACTDKPGVLRVPQDDSGAHTLDPSSFPKVQQQLVPSSFSFSEWRVRWRLDTIRTRRRSSPRICLKVKFNCWQDRLKRVHISTYN